MHKICDHRTGNELQVRNGVCTMASKRPSIAGGSVSRNITSFFLPKDLEITSDDESPAPPPCKQNNARHRSSFDPSWIESFPWLIYIPEQDEEGPSMYCELCRKYNTTTKRIVWANVPCQQFRKDKLREHQASQRHADAVETTMETVN